MASFFFEVPLVVDTAQYAPADVLFATTLVPNSTMATDRAAYLESMVLREAATFQTYTAAFHFFDANVSIGAANAAAALSVVNAANIIGRQDVVAADFASATFSAVRFAFFKSMRMLLNGGNPLYVAGTVLTGTPTFGAAGNLVLRLGFTSS